MRQDIPRSLLVSAESVIFSPAFGSALKNETVGVFLDRTISFCKDPRLIWRAKFSVVCGKRVDCLIIFNYPGFRELRCPHCEAIACFQIVSKDSE